MYATGPMSVILVYRCLVKALDREVSTLEGLAGTEVQWPPARK
jgi:hypothetical protein